MMALFRRKDERAIPKPGSKEFEEAVRGAPVEPAEEAKEEPQATVEEAEPAADELEGPDQRTRRGKVLGSLGRSILRPPNTEGIGGGISGQRKGRKPEV